MGKKDGKDGDGAVNRIKLKQELDLPCTRKYEEDKSYKRGRKLSCVRPNKQTGIPPASSYYQKNVYDYFKKSKDKV